MCDLDQVCAGQPVQQGLKVLLATAPVSSVRSQFRLEGPAASEEQGSEGSPTLRAEGLQRSQEFCPEEKLQKTFHILQKKLTFGPIFTRNGIKGLNLFKIVVRKNEKKIIYF